MSPRAHRQGLKIAGAMLACWVAFFILLGWNEERTVIFVQLAANAVDGTDYNPLIRWLKAYTGDLIIPTPLVALVWRLLGRGDVDMRVLVPWAFDNESLQKASAELGDWIPRLVALAAWPWTYWFHADFMFMAIVLSVTITWIRIVEYQIRRRVFDWRLIAAWHFAVLKGSVTKFLRLALMSIAPRILLTTPTALAVVAHFIAHGGTVTALDCPNGGRLYKVMQGVRLLGLAMVLDVLVFDGRIKLACTALLAHHLFTSSLSPGYSFNGAHHLSMWPAILLDCFLHPDAAALMTGPLIKSYRAIGLEQWLGGPQSPLLQRLVPHGYLHAIMCMGLVIYNCFLFGGTQMMETTDGRKNQLYTTVSLLVFGFGFQGTLFFATVFACLEAYAVASGPFSAPSHSQAARQRPIKPGAKSIKDIVEGRLGNIVQDPPVESEQRIREGNCRTPPARFDASGAVAAMGGLCSEARPQSHTKGAHGGSNRTKAKKTTLKPAKQPEKQPASHVPVKAPSPHRDEAACLQQSPAHAELPPQTNAYRSKVQAPARGVQDQSPPVQQEGCTDAQAAQKTAKVRKQKAARRRTAKNKAANLQTSSSGSSSDLSASSFTGEAPSQKKQAAAGSVLVADSDSHKEQEAAARVPVAEEASPKPLTQPQIDEQTLHRPSSPKHPALKPAHELPQLLQQSTPETAQKIHRSPISPRPDAALCGPRLPVPNGQPTDARQAPVRLSKATLQHRQSSAAHSRPPPLHALLPTSAPRDQLHRIQALLGVSQADQVKAQGRTPQQQPHAEATRNAYSTENNMSTALPPFPAACTNCNVASEKEITERERTCIMCWERPRQATLAPCGHHALCSPCTQLLLKTPDALCPVCRSSVHSFILKDFGD